MLNLEETEALLRGDPNVFITLIAQAMMNDPDAMPAMLELVKHQHECGCETGTLEAAEELAASVNAFIRKHAVRTTNIASVLGFLTEPDQEATDQSRH